MNYREEIEQADYSNPYMFDKCYPGYDLMDYNAEEAYEMGVNAGSISEKQDTEALVKKAVVEELEGLRIDAVDIYGDSSVTYEQIDQAITKIKENS